MLLTIDVGNTNTVLGVFDGPELIEHWRIATEARRTSDELALLLHGLLGESAVVPQVAGHITGIACCSTVPAVLHQVREMCQRWFAPLPAVIVEPGVRTGVPVLMDNPKEVGSDRIINTLAAFTLHGGPAVVVDFGTSTNFDVVSVKGEFLGGALAPGIEISVDALAGRAAQLRKVELIRPRSVIGKNTVEALQSGILFGFAGQVDRIVELVVTELGGCATVIATGGLAPLVLAESRTIDVHEPWLTLIGLRLVYERNVTA
ncbi:MAG TPA: type III pantothenate kinase [Mycobacteriales bacterium]|nr:type III pantothenate kinase [Mycobacteriales bacterium]